MLPCLLYEDDHLLVVNKPAGINTHAANPHASEGIYDWLRHREPGWANLAIVHRLDKETSGVLVFGKTSLANKSLTEQFTRRRIRKRYVFLTDGEVASKEVTVKSALVRAGARYVSRPAHIGGEIAETRFRKAQSDLPVKIPQGMAFGLVEAEPVTGRTHQIRVHAADRRTPVLGDAIYGGTPFPRVCLHAAELTLDHPASGHPLTLRAPADFASDPHLALREAFVESDQTNAYRIFHGAADGWPGWYVDRVGQFALSQGAHLLNDQQIKALRRLMDVLGLRGAYHKSLRRRVAKTAAVEVSPQFVMGDHVEGRFPAMENGLSFELSFGEGYSVGLFLDQRDNRRRALTRHVATGFPLFAQGANPTVLNTFAYTCGFSVCAAKAGAHTTSVDLSRKYLDWGRANFIANGLDPAAHDFIYGDTFDWLRRFERKGRRFDLVLLDPPTFSQSKHSGKFQAQKDYGKLVSSALPLVKPGGVLFASTNDAEWAPEHFLQCVTRAIARAGRSVLKSHYVPQPPDFPMSKTEPGYLKTMWLRLD